MLLLAAGLALLAPPGVLANDGAQENTEKAFDLQAGDAPKTLRVFSEQSGVQVLFPSEIVEGVQTNAVRGAFTPHGALEQMVSGTRLMVVYDEKTGALGIRLKAPPSDPEKKDPSQPGRAGGSEMPAGDPSGNAADADAIRLSPFEVAGQNDKGYLAGNSVSATRVNTPIKDLPFAISAFTSQFIRDTGADKLLEIANYSPGVRSNVINVQIGDATFAIRGFSQAPQHNGFYDTPLANDFVDPQNVERVEIVKGPASLLYGQVSPGGTINYITKSPQPNAFTQIGGEIGSYNFSRATLDINRPLIGQVLLFRLNGSFEYGTQYTDRAKSKTRMLAPAVTWNIAPRLALKVDYQWYNRHEYAPTQYLPPTEISTAQSMVNALYNAGYPSPSAALVNKTGPAVAEGYADASDPGFVGLYPALPHTFNIAAVDDTRTTDLQSVHAELDAKISDHWSSRANFAFDLPRITLTATGVANLFLAPPNSLLYSNNAWSVAPAWAALTAAQQTAATLAFAQQSVDNLGTLLATQNGTPAPAIINRPPRVQERFGSGRTMQAEAAGDYDFGGVTIKPLVGVLYDSGFDKTRNTQNAGTAASPAFRTWDVDPSSPTYFIDPLTPGYTKANLTVLNAYTSAYTSDQGVYGVINAGFFEDRLIVVGGVRYNESQSQTTNYLANPSILQGLRAKFTTPQVGVGFKVTPGMMLYASYSESYTLPSQAFLTTPGIVNGVTAAVPTTPTSPTIGKGYEVGVKTDFLNGRVSSTLSLYQIDQDNVVQSLNQTISGIGVQIYVQGEVIHARGAEAEITWSPLDNLQVYASAAEEDIRIASEPFGLSYYLGETPNSAAKTTANLWSRYTFRNNAFEGSWLGGGFQYTGKSAGDPRDVAYFLPAYTLFNCAAGYDWKAGHTLMTAALNWKNIGGTFYKQTTGSAGDPRRMSFTVTGRF